MKLTDTHAHLFTEEFDADRDEAVARCLENGVEKIVMPAIDGASHEKLLACCRKYPLFRPAMGLHPTSVRENYREELELAGRLLRENRREIVAVGEIGLDLYWSRDFFEEQLVALRFQLEWALREDLPVILHTRDAFPEMERELKNFEGRGLRVVFHGYSGDREWYERLNALDMGVYYGIGGVVTFKNSSLPETVRAMDLNKILLETDAPYLSPAPYRGKRNESARIPLIAEKIAALKGVRTEEVAEITTKNAESFFKI